MEVSGSSDIMIINGNSHPELASLVARYHFFDNPITWNNYWQTFYFILLINFPCWNILNTFSRLGVKLGGCTVAHKTNRETLVEIGDSVRGKDIYIIQTGTK